MMAPDKDSGGGGRPLNANDPAAVKAFMEQMARETGKDIHGRPVAQKSDTAKGGTKPAAPFDRPKTAEQIRLEAAGLWRGDKAEKVAAFQDEIQPLKDAVRASGVSWSVFAGKANAARLGGAKDRKDSYRIALEELEKGDEAFQSHLEKLGLKKRSFDAGLVAKSMVRFLKGRR
jgi:hypothetical protein